MIKKISKSLLYILLLSAGFAFAQASSENLDSFDQELDAMFDQAEDTSAVVTRVKENQAETQKKEGIKFSGHLDSEVGAAFVYQHEETCKPNGYFSLNNYLYMDARPTSESKIRGVLGISFPYYTLGLNEFYFDYIVKNRLVFTAGKKSTTWGYPRLFSTATNATQLQVDESVVKAVSAENTNILYDSNPCGMSLYKIDEDNPVTTTLMARIPVGSGTITALALYPVTSDSTNNPSFADMIFAASFELLVEKTSVNVFGRGGMKEKKKVGDEKRNVGPLIGLEAKRTILGTDFYGQGMARFDSNKKFARIFNSRNFYEQTFNQFMFTGGFYHWWDEIDYPVGLNIEYQLVRSVFSDEDELKGTSNSHALAFEGGVKGLGKKHNIKLGLEAVHNITNKCGFVKPGIIISGALPSCDWKNGIKWEYGNGLPATGKFTVGSYLTLSLNY